MPAWGPKRPKLAPDVRAERLHHAARTSPGGDSVRLAALIDTIWSHAFERRTPASAIEAASHAEARHGRAREKPCVTDLQRLEQVVLPGFSPRP